MGNFFWGGGPWVIMHVRHLTREIGWWWDFEFAVGVERSVYSTGLYGVR